MVGGSILLEIVNLHKYYNELHVLKGINLEIKAQEVVVILGPTYVGKSTLLRCINFSQQVDEGEIWFQGIKITQKQKEIGVILRHFNLFPHKTVLENVIETPTIIQKESKEKATELGLRLLQKVGLKERAYVYPKSLSASEKQRVSIARTLVMNPKILLIDEPVTDVNQMLAAEFIEVIKSLAKEKVTMVITADDADFARDFADRIVCLENGKIVGQKTADEFYLQR